MKDGDPNGWQDRTVSCDALAAKLTELLEQLDEDDRDYWLAELAEIAERRGWVDNANVLRREPPWLFALDLFVDNPRALELVAINFEHASAPHEVEEIYWFADHL